LTNSSNEISDTLEPKDEKASLIAELKQAGIRHTPEKIMKKIKIKLMTDYYSHPLWGLDSDNIGDIDPKKLPLSQETIDRLENWAATYNAILNQEDPASSSFDSPQSEEDFEQEGIRLWLQVRQELPENYEVWYFSDRLQKEVSDLKELMAII
jgi:hypothetical protein